MYTYYTRYVILRECNDRRIQNIVDKNMNIRINQLLIALIVILIILNIRLPFFNTPLFYLFNSPITLYHLLVFGCLAWLAMHLPSPFREIIAIFLFLWLISISGIFFYFGWWANIILLLIVIILILSVI